MELSTVVTGDFDPIAKMIWSLQPDNESRYPPRFKVVLDYFGLVRAVDDKAVRIAAAEVMRKHPERDEDKVIEYQRLRIASISFIEIAKQKSEWVEDRLMEFITSQKQRVKDGKIKPITIRNYIKATKRFCEMNRINLSWTLISKGMPSGRPSGDDRAPTSEELARLIGDDLRLKVIVTIMSSCGIRVGAWDYLKVKHLTPLPWRDITLATMRVYAGQQVGKRKEYQTLISPEAYHAFQEYLANRTAAGEVITGESWVVRDYWKTTNIRRGGYYGVATIPKRVKASGVKKNIDDALWRRGIRLTPAKHHEFKECHGFRKYFKTYAQRTMKEANVERLMGHAGNWSNAAYDRPLEDWLIEEYLKAVPDLTIYKPDKVIEQTQQLVAKVESKDKEMDRMKERMEAMEYQLNSFQDFMTRNIERVSRLTEDEAVRLDKEIEQLEKEGRGVTDEEDEDIEVRSLARPIKPSKKRGR